MDRISEMRLALSALEETYEEERSEHTVTRVLKEDLELQIDKMKKVRMGIWGVGCTRGGS